MVPGRARKGIGVCYWKCVAAKVLKSWGVKVVVVVVVRSEEREESELQKRSGMDGTVVEGVLIVVRVEQRLRGLRVEIGNSGSCTV